MEVFNFENLKSFDFEFKIQKYWRAVLNMKYKNKFKHFLEIVSHFNLSYWNRYTIVNV